MPVGPLVQLSSLVAMAPLLRGLGLMGTGVESLKRGCSGPIPGPSVIRVSSLREGLWGL